MNAPAFSRRKRTRGLPRYDIGGMFQGSGAGTASRSTSTSDVTLDPGGQYTDLMHGVMSGAQNLLGRQYEPYDPSQRFAGLTPDQQQAYAQIEQNQGAWQPYLNQASSAFNTAQSQAAGVGTAGMPAFNQGLSGPSGLGAAQPYMGAASQSWTDPGVANQWMNPYTQNVLGNVANTAERSFTGPGGALQGMTDAFTGGGSSQFGRERMGQVGNQLAYNFGQGLTGALAQPAMTGYQQGMQGQAAEQQRLAGMGSTAGQLALGQTNAMTGLGTALTNQATAGVNANINAGTAQQNLGQTRSQLGFQDANQLLQAGAQQQQLQQMQKDFAYQQNREAFNFPVANLQAAQGLGQGWQLPSQTQSQAYSWGSTTPASGSPFGQALGAGLSLASLATPGASGTSALGNIFGGMFGAEGGSVPRDLKLAFGPGGMVPLVKGMRQRTQARMPAMMMRQRQMQGPGLTPGQTPGMMPPMMAPAGGGPPPGGGGPAFARGGSVERGFGPPPDYPASDWASRLTDRMMGSPRYPIEDDPNAYKQLIQQLRAPQQPYGSGWAGGGYVDDEAQDRAMVARGIHQHERAMHDADQLTQLRLAFGGPIGFDDGGSADDALLNQIDYGGQFLRQRPRFPTPGGGSWSVSDPNVALGDTRSGARRAFDTVRNVASDIPGAFAQAGRQWIDDPMSGLAATARLPFAAVDLARNLTQGSLDAAGRIGSRYLDPASYERDPLGAAIETGWDASDLGLGLPKGAGRVRRLLRGVR